LARERSVAGSPHSLGSAARGGSTGAADAAGSVLPEGVEGALAASAEALVAGVAYAQDGAFIHLGTTRDFHDALSAGSLLRRLFPFTSQRDSLVASGAQ